MVWSLPQAVCPIDSAAVKGITAQQSVQVNGIAAQACASWLTYMLRRRYWYICWADTSWLTIHLPLGRTYYDGGTDTYICWANTSWLTIHLHLPLGRTYMLRRRYISWADNTHILRRSRIAYTFYLGEHHLGGATRTLPTWADVSFGNTLLAGRWYLSRRTCSFGRLCNVYGEPSPSQASKATWILPWLFTGDVYVSRSYARTLSSITNSNRAENHW